MTAKASRIDRRTLMTAMLAGGLTAPLTAGSNETNARGGSHDSYLLRNPLLWAVAWSNTAAEFGALCHQAFNFARLRVDQAVQRNTDSKHPLAVITDVDNTIVHASSYWSFLVNEGKDFFDDQVWDEWIPKNLITLVPGAEGFLAHCEEQQVEVFYVTNRDQGPNTYDYALRQLQYLELPFADRDHLTVFTDSSDKTPARDTISQTHELILLLGDNLNDFKRDYYVSDIKQRFALMERDKKELGDRFVLLPNATDGHWVRAIFGESEPPATEENRQALFDAATRGAWDGA